MRKELLRTIVCVIAMIICLLAINVSFGQRYVRRTPDKILQPVFIQEEEAARALKWKFGFGMDMYTSGNAHGTFYSARVHISRGKSTFSFGPCLQKRLMEVNGIRLNYAYLLTGINEGYDQDEEGENKNDPHDVLELRLLVSAQYIEKGGLSYKASRVETITNPESKVNYNNLRFSTIEGSVCLDLGLNLKWTRLRAYMGAGVFNHFNYMNGMYRPKCSPTLMFGTGFIIPEFK